MIDVPVQSADFDALEQPMRRWAAVVKARSIQAKGFNAAARAWAEEVDAARGGTGLRAAQIRFAERLRLLDEEFGDLSVESSSSLSAIDAALRPLLVRAAAAGIEPADYAEIGESLSALATLPDMARNELRLLYEINATVDSLGYLPLQERLTLIVTGIRQMEEQQPVLDGWKRLILQIQPED